MFAILNYYGVLDIVTSREPFGTYELWRPNSSWRERKAHLLIALALTGPMFVQFEYEVESGDPQHVWQALCRAFGGQRIRQAMYNRRLQPHERVADYVADMQTMAADLEHEYDDMTPRDVVATVFIGAMRVYLEVAVEHLDTSTWRLYVDTSLSEAVAVLERAERERMQQDAQERRAQCRATASRKRQSMKKKKKSSYKRKVTYHTVHTMQRGETRRWIQHHR